MSEDRNNSDAPAGSTDTRANSNRYERVVDLLRQPGTYPEAPDAVNIIETHISCVFLTDRFVYKLKKPVHYDFCDFSTLAAREHACREEVRLNRRLAHNVYLGVLPIIEDQQHTLHLEGDLTRDRTVLVTDTVVDWVVKMRRLPTENTLDVLVRAGRLSDAQISQLAAKLAEFYAVAVHMPVAAREYVSEIRRHVSANRRELLSPDHARDATVVSRIHGAQLQYLSLAEPLFDVRVGDGRIIEGHGDLRPEHICFEDKPAIFDCIEFNPELRQVDVADELGFLAMECDRLGASAVGRRIVDVYATRSGDRPPQALLSFYKSYRACVRGKVAALRARQLAGATQTAALDEAREYLRLADGYVADFSRPLVVVVGGLMGCGKSTLAAALAELFACPRLATDAIRQELLGATKTPSNFDEGMYQPENRERVYDKLLDRAEGFLAERISVILDGTFLTAAWLDRASQLAAKRNSEFLVVRCVCPDDVARKRIADRAATGGDPSEARPELYDRQKAELRPCPDQLPCVEVDTTVSLETQVHAVIAKLRCAVGT